MFVNTQDYVDPRYSLNSESPMMMGMTPPVHGKDVHTQMCASIGACSRSLRVTTGVVDWLLWVKSIEGAGPVPNRATRPHWQ